MSLAEVRFPVLRHGRCLSGHDAIADIRRLYHKPIMQVRPECPDDESAISRLITAAFLAAEHRDGTEADIVQSLRTANALTVSLVATIEASVIGHAAFSPVTVDGREAGWFGLGPVSVLPSHQRQGIGSRLIEDGLAQLRQQGAQCCVVLGDPAFYSRFGFTYKPELWLANVPPMYFTVASLGDGAARGEIKYHAAFRIA